MNHRALHFARALGCWNSIQTPINTVTKFNKAMEDVGEMDFLAPLCKNILVELITKGSCKELDAHQNDTRCRHQNGRVRHEVHLSGHKRGNDMQEELRGCVVRAMFMKLPAVGASDFTDLVPVRLSDF